MSKFEYRAGARAPKGIEAEVVGSELERIRVANGGQLIPEDVVKASAPKKAPLHGAFEWDNAAAGAAWRAWQARVLIKSVRIVHEGGDAHPAFYHVKIQDAPRPYYQSAEEVKARPDEFAAAVRDLRSRVDQANSALDALKRLAEGSSKPKASNLAIIGSIAEGLQAVRSLAERLN